MPVGKPPAPWISWTAREGTGFAGVHGEWKEKNWLRIRKRNQGTEELMLGGRRKENCRILTVGSHTHTYENCGNIWRFSCCQKFSGCMFNCRQKTSLRNRCYSRKQDDSLTFSLPHSCFLLELNTGLGIFINALEKVKMFTWIYLQAFPILSIWIVVKLVLLSAVRR